MSPIAAFFLGIIVGVVFVALVTFMSAARDFDHDQHGQHPN